MTGRRQNLTPRPWKSGQNFTSDNCAKRRVKVCKDLNKSEGGQDVQDTRVSDKDQHNLFDTYNTPDPLFHLNA